MAESREKALSRLTDFGEMRPDFTPVLLDDCLLQLQLFRRLNSQPAADEQDRQRHNNRAKPKDPGRRGERDFLLGGEQYLGEQPTQGHKAKQRREAEIPWEWERWKVSEIQIAARPGKFLWPRKQSVGLTHEPVGDEADPLLRGPVELDQG